MARPLLELVVGIDLGFTCTGVAFYPPDETGLPIIANKSHFPTIIPEWPRRQTASGAPIIDGIKHKVPTRLAYRGGVEEYLWGFDSPPPGDYKSGYNVLEHFKLFLEEEVLEEAFGGVPELAPGSFRDVKNWFRDFLRALYRHVVSYFEKRFGKELWETGRVEYIFSIPTVWAPQKTQKPVVALFKTIIEEAGFGSTDNHTVAIGLSEAKAAAIYTAMFPTDHHQVIRPDFSAVRSGQAASRIGMVAFEKGDVLLVCDAGGGTTDVCVLEVWSNTDSPIELGQLSQVKGLPHGSVQIDFAFRKEAEGRLISVKETLHEIDPRLTPRYAAMEMTRGDFQFHKHKCGGPLADLGVVPIAVPGLPKDFDLEEARIKGGHMLFTKDEIESMFKDEVNGIIDLIDKQLNDLKMSDSPKEVTYIVLAGGLGSSPYVQKCLWAKYESRMKILASNEPQLAVCKGLVIDRIHRLRASALTSRRYPASYGILIKRHRKQTKIRWIIEKGELVKEEICGMSRIIDMASPKKVWTDKIVMSTADKQKLPTHLPVEVIAILESSLHLSPLPVEVIATLESNLYFSPYRTLDPDTTPGVKAVPRTFSSHPKYEISYEIIISIVSGGLEFRSKLVGADKEMGEKLVPIIWPVFPDVTPNDREEEGEGAGD